jgi:hypothetical protein
MAFYGYFLFHELGDEVMFYQAYGDYAVRAPAETRFLKSLARSASLLLLAVLASLYFGCAWVENHRLLRQLPEGRAPLALAFLGAAALLGLLRTACLGVALYGGVQRAVARHLPLLFVYGWLLAILSIGSLLGTTGLNSIILIHVTVWIVFTYHQLSNRSRSPCYDLWSWLRTTPAGFLTLHVGVAIGFLLLMMMSIYCWDNHGWLSALLAGKNFCYWGLMHISMSLWNAR